MFRKPIISLLIFLSATFLALSFAPPASALQAGDIVMQVAPAEQALELSPGMHHTGRIEVENIGRLPFNFNLSVRPYQVLNESYDPDFSTQNNYTRLSSWISFSQTQYHLEAGASVEIEFTIDVPQGVPGGGQYAAIIIETRDSQDANATMQTINQLASLLYAHVDGEEHIGGVLMAQTLPRVLLGSPFSSVVTVKNDGNVDFRADHTLTIRDFFTNREVFAPVEVANPAIRQPAAAELIILPGTSRTNILTWTGAPRLGIFRATSRIKFLDQDSIKEQIVFICPVWLMGIAVFFIILVILWLVLRIRKRGHSRPPIV